MAGSATTFERWNPAAGGVDWHALRFPLQNRDQTRSEIPAPLRARGLFSLAEMRYLLRGMR